VPSGGTKVRDVFVICKNVSDYNVTVTLANFNIDSHKKNCNDK